MIHFNFLSLDFAFEKISFPSFKIKHSLSEKLQYLFEHTITIKIQQTKALFTGQVRVIQSKTTDVFNYFRSSVKERELTRDEAKQFKNKEGKHPMPNSDLSLSIAPKAELQKTSRPCIPLINIAKAIEQKAIDDSNLSFSSSLDTQKVLDEGSLPAIPLSPLRQKNVEKPLQELPLILDAPLKELPSQELFASVEICDSTSEIIEAQQANDDLVSSAILFSPPPFFPQKSPPPPLFGLKKTNQYFENEPKIDTLPKRLEIEKMKDRKSIEEKIVLLKKQLGELQEALIPIKLALDEDDRLNVAQQANQQELALIQKQLKDNQQKLLQLENSPYARIAFSRKIFNSRKAI